MRWTISMLEAKVPPPLLVILLAGIVWLSPRAQAPAGVLPAVGVALIVAGLGINAFSKVPYRRAGTSVSPIRPDSATALITSGPYRFSRNPMYLGYALALLGWAVWLAQPMGLLAFAGFIAYITRFQIMPEERYLSSLFPTQYAAYSREVRRWI